MVAYGFTGVVVCVVSGATGCVGVGGDAGVAGACWAVCAGALGNGIGVNNVPCPLKVGAKLLDD